MPFGKHKGRDLEDLPDSYVAWLAGLDDLREPLASAVLAEAEARGLLPEPPARVVPRLVPALIERGFRVLAKERHPDVGGTDAAMRDVIEARDYLRDLVGAPQ